jgi:chromosome segregation ATPase
VRKRFRRTFLGYVPAHVTNALKLQNDHHQTQMEQMRRELAQLNERISTAQKGLQILREELASTKSVEQAMADTLVKAHREASARVLLAIRETEQAEEKVRQQVAHKETQVAELQSQLSEIRREVQAMADRYSQAVTRVEEKH